MMKPQQLRHRRTPLTLTAALWAALLLISQTLAVAHVHLELAPDTVCASCTLAKPPVAAGDGAPPPPAERLPHAPPRTPATAPVVADDHGPFLARAPPRA